MKGNVNDIECDVHVVDNETGENILINLMHPIMLMLIDLIVIPIINNKLSTGIPIPPLEGLSLRNAHSNHGDGFLALGTDCNYDS